MSLVAATVKILTDEALADGRIFGPELPQSQHSEMPRKCVTVRGSGGSQTMSQHWMRTGDIRVDVKCFGATPWEAAELEGQVAAVLQTWRQAAVDVAGTDVRVLWFNQSGGPNQLRDPDTDWPYALSTWQVFGERYV